MILSIGSVNLDVEMHVPRWPDPGEAYLANGFMLLAGGKGANVALVARRLGASAGLVGRIGDDPWSSRVLERLIHASVDLSHLRIATDEPTGLAAIFVQPGGKKTIVLAANANDRWRNLDDAADAVAEAGADTVVVADLEVPHEVVRRAARKTRERDLPFVLDPSPADRVDDELLSLCTVVTPNPSETASLTGIWPGCAEEAFAAGARLLERGAQTACVKFNRGDCALVTRDLVVHVRPGPVRAVDTTGAGDAFTGALAVALQEGRGLVEATRFGVACSNAAVTGYGSSPSYPDRRELDRRLAALPPLRP